MDAHKKWVVQQQKNRLSDLFLKRFSGRLIIRPIGKRHIGLSDIVKVSSTITGPGYLKDRGVLGIKPKACFMDLIPRTPLSFIL